QLITIEEHAPVFLHALAIIRKRGLCALEQDSHTRFRRMIDEWRTILDGWLAARLRDELGIIVFQDALCAGLREHLPVSLEAFLVFDCREPLPAVNAPVPPFERRHLAVPRRPFAI